MSQPKHHNKGKVSINTGVLSAPAPAPDLAPVPALTPRYLKRVMRQQKLREKKIKP